MRFKDSYIRSKYFKKYKFLNQDLVLTLLFQSETLKYIRDQYGVTNADYKVLCATRLYTKTKKVSFRPYLLEECLPGMWMEQIYKSFRNLEKRGLIESYKDVEFKTYTISSFGDSCLKSYAKKFDEIFYGRIKDIA